MKRIKLVHGSARVKENVRPETVKALNVLVILAHQQMCEDELKPKNNDQNIISMERNSSQETVQSAASKGIE